MFYKKKESIGKVSLGSTEKKKYIEDIQEIQSQENKQEPRSCTKIICTARAIAGERKKPSNYF